MSTASARDARASARAARAAPATPDNVDSALALRDPHELAPAPARGSALWEAPRDPFDGAMDSFFGGGLLGSPFFGGPRGGPLAALDALMSRPWGGASPSLALTVKESPRELVYSFDAPGVTPEHVKVHVDEARRVLHVNVSTSGGTPRGGGGGAREPDASGYTTVHTERYAASASRSISLPPSADLTSGGADTWIESGQLHVALPKGAPAQAPTVRSLPVGTGRRY